MKYLVAFRFNDTMSEFRFNETVTLIENILAYVTKGYDIKMSESKSWKSDSKTSGSRIAIYTSQKVILEEKYVLEVHDAVTKFGNAVREVGTYLVSPSAGYSDEILHRRTVTQQ